jgi:hypothetical protein
MIFFDYKGEEVSPENKNIVAKQLFFEETKTFKYLVRVCSHGPESGLFFNPQTHEKEMLNKIDNYTGRERFFFRPTSKESFDLYTKFLQTGNVSLLRNAQRS